MKYQNDEAITNKEDGKNEPKSPQKTASELIEDLKMKAESAVKNNKDQLKSPKNSETTPSHDANKVLKDLKKTESDFQKLKNEWEAKIKKLENDLTEQKIESQLQLKKQETKFNELYLEKMKEKAQKADQIIKAKTAELETKFNEKLQELKKYGLEKTGGELVDIISKFEMVISQEPDDPKLKNYFQGFVMFKGLFDHFLTRNKIHKTEIQVGDQFDPGIMEAFENVTVYDPKQDHKVLKVLNPCYKLHDRVIKYALVEVGNYQPKTDQE